MQNTHFSGLTRKNPAFERSVLKYVSIKNRILTPSGQKRRVCVNALDRLSPPPQTPLPFCFTTPCHRAASPQTECNPWDSSPRNHRNWCNSLHPAACAWHTPACTCRNHCTAPFYKNGTAQTCAQPPAPHQKDKQTDTSTSAPPAPTPARPR